MGDATRVTVDGDMDLVVWRTRSPWNRGGYFLSVWEPNTFRMSGPQGPETHSTIGGPGSGFGQVGTRGLPAWIEALPGGSPERRAACEGWRQGQDVLAMEAIVLAHPEAYGRKMDCHEVEVF